jgi:murein DD-endopeptidase MepM/ murein hydrolase activator NlpD
MAPVGLAMLLTASSAILSAKQLYEYTDENGIRHFTDTPPQTDAPVKSTRVQVEEKPLVRLETAERTDGASELIVHNLIDGPIEVDLRLRDAVNVTTTPSLPKRFVLPGRGRHSLAVATIADRHQSASYSVEIAQAVPGDPHARPSTDATYRIPFPTGTRFAIGQAFGGGFSHTDPQNFHAVDFGVEEGTPIVAARDGVVIQVERDFYESGGDRARLSSRANHVRVMHEDGTMAVYAHLAYETVLVEAGDVVLAGQRIGSAGATGFATGPHLHFVVQRNAGLKLESIPFRISGPRGPFTPERSPAWQIVP